MYISKKLITDAMAKKQKSEAVGELEDNLIFLSLDKLHTTELGAARIKRNPHLNVDDVVGWCREKMQSKNSHITRMGKNWYILVDGCEITVNVHSNTIITAHKHL